MKYLKIVNWSEFQHYKDRSPPWIKLHGQILENYDYTSLPDHSKAHLIGLWLLASRTDNKIPSDPKWLANKLGATEEVNVQTLIDAGFISYHDASNTLANCYSDRTESVPQKRREEKRREEESGRFTPPSVNDVREYCESRNNGISAEAFVSFYQSKGWLVGKSKMKDWKASIRTWETKNKSNTQYASSLDEVHLI
jgi:hypothetical protein